MLSAYGFSRSSTMPSRSRPAGQHDRYQWWLLVGLLGLSAPLPAAAQSRSEPASDCGTTICLQTGVGRWQIEPSEYCEAEVCLQDSLASVLELDWDRMPAGRDSVTARAANPFVGLTDAEYQRLGALGDDELAQRVQLLGKVRLSCEAKEFKLRLNVPGRDIVLVTFATPLATAERSQNFQVTAIDRTFRGLPGGSIGWWIRWVTYRFPGIVLMQGEPTDFANYEIGLYMGRLLLVDQTFEFGAPAEYAGHPECATR
jgi:hypothetical protein